MDVKDKYLNFQRGVMNGGNISVRMADFKDIHDIYDVIVRCLDKKVEGDYPEATVNGLRTIYTPKGIGMKLRDKSNEVWVAEKNDELKWVCELNPYDENPNSDFVEGNGHRFDDGKGIEIKTFYGLDLDCATACMVNAKKVLANRGGDYLSGLVLRCGWKFFERLGKVNGELYSTPSMFKLENYRKPDGSKDSQVFHVEVKYYQIESDGVGDY